MQEIILKLHFGDLIGGFVVKIDEHANGSCIALLSTLAHSGKLQGSHGFLVIILHHTLLSWLKVCGNVTESMTKKMGVLQLDWSVGNGRMLKVELICREAAYLNL
jgi:hypothetical protein